MTYATAVVVSISVMCVTLVVIYWLTLRNRP